jgi:hypothetical protein
LKPDLRAAARPPAQLRYYEIELTSFASPF